MRIAHITDIHVMEPPRFTQLWGKRAMGSVNLFVLGRKSKFSRRVQEALAESVLEAEPDAVLFTGDATAQATEEEFKAFRSLYGPVLSRQPSAVIPGNHDTYTHKSYRQRAIEDHLGEWTGQGDWPRLHLLSDKLACVAVDACRAHMTSSGKVDQAQLQRLDKMLGASAVQGREVFVLIHYPLRNRRGEPYGPPARALSNAAAVEDVLLKHAHRIRAVLHGHEHHGYRTKLGSGPKSIDILNPGSSGYAWTPEKDRTAHFNIYTITEGNLEIERFRYDGDRDGFFPEPGGAYATGR